MKLHLRSGRDLVWLMGRIRCKTAVQIRLQGRLYKNTEKTMGNREALRKGMTLFKQQPSRKIANIDVAFQFCPPRHRILSIPVLHVLLNNSVAHLPLWLEQCHSTFFKCNIFESYVRVPHKARFLLHLAQSFFVDFSIKLSRCEKTCFSKISRWHLVLQHMFICGKCLGGFQKTSFRIKFGMKIFLEKC